LVEEKIMERWEECEHGEQMTALMSLALDDLLEDPDRQQLEQHLMTCATCRQEWEAMQQISALFKMSPQVGPPLGFATRVERRLAETNKKRRQLFGGVAVLTSSLSLAGMTVITLIAFGLGIAAWRWLDSAPSAQQENQAVSQVVSGISLLGRGASLFLGDLLLRYGAPLLLVLGISLAVLVTMWVWLYRRRPDGKRDNGYV
jgi:predicted anti-sigma-YlaC factor YlaD